MRKYFLIIGVYLVTGILLLTWLDIANRFWEAFLQNPADGNLIRIYLLFLYSAIALPFAITTALFLIRKGRQ